MSSRFLHLCLLQKQNTSLEMGGHRLVKHESRQQGGDLRSSFSWSTR